MKIMYLILSSFYKKAKTPIAHEDIISIFEVSGIFTLNNKLIFELIVK